MKKQHMLATIPLAITTMLILGCNDVGRGMAGNIYEKMTIFSLLTLTIFAVLLIPFVSGTSESRTLALYRELIRNAAAVPLSADDLTAHPVYVWDSARSFRKMLFARDNSLLESAIITSNGPDPALETAGTWAITPGGDLQLFRRGTSCPKLLTRISPDGYHLATLMRLKSGLADAWFFGASALVEVQIACFGYSGSLPSLVRSPGKFTASLVRGLTVYWASYPCTALTSSNEVAVNPLLAFGVLTFHADGTLAKSINNPIDAVPDYQPRFRGTWRVDENFGVLNLSVGLYATEITLLFHDAEHQSLLVGTLTGSEQWFLDPERAKRDLLAYLAIGVHLDAGKGALYE
jgi:hypothetical protein